MGCGEKWREKKERESDSRWRRFEISDQARCFKTRERERDRREDGISAYRRKEPVAGRDVLVGEHSVHHIATTPIDCSDCLHSIDKAPATSQTRERRVPQIPALGPLPFRRVFRFHFDRKTSVFQRKTWWSPDHIYDSNKKYIDYTSLAFQLKTDRTHPKFTQLFINSTRWRN